MPEISNISYLKFLKNSGINTFLQNKVNNFYNSHKNKKMAPEKNDNVLSYPLKEAREKFEKDYLTSQIRKHRGNISKTAEFVGMERSALHRKLKTLGIKDLN